MMTAALVRSAELANSDGEAGSRSGEVLAGNAPPSETGRKAHDETLYLIGRPPIKHVLRFARSQAIDPPEEGALVDAWNAAHRVLRRIEHDEAGAADNPPIKKLGAGYEPLLRELLKDPLIRHNFNTVPTEIALVELDRLVVYQKHIDLTFARSLAEKLGPAPSEEMIFRTCLPFDHPQPPVEWSAVSADQYIFMSPSNDLRFLGALPLKANNVMGYRPPGVPAGVIGLTVGFGSNFLNAIAAEGRIILHNGSHRAYALREMGVTHVPCIIQHVSSRHELSLVGPSQVRHDPGLYLERRRPPMLKDYFNPGLRIVFPVHRSLRQVVIKFQVEEHYVRAI